MHGNPIWASNIQTPISSLSLHSWLGMMASDRLFEYARRMRSKTQTSSQPAQVVYTQRSLMCSILDHHLNIFSWLMITEKHRLHGSSQSSPRGLPTTPIHHVLIPSNPTILRLQVAVRQLKPHKRLGLGDPQVATTSSSIFLWRHFLDTKGAWHVQKCQKDLTHVMCINFLCWLEPGEYRSGYGQTFHDSFPIPWHPIPIPAEVLGWCVGWQKPKFHEYRGSRARCGTAPAPRTEHKFDQHCFGIFG